MSENEVYSFEATDEEPAQDIGPAVLDTVYDPDAELRRKVAAMQQEFRCGKSEHNDFSDFDYRTVPAILEALKPLLEKHGLMLTVRDRPEVVGSWMYVHSVVTLTDIETGASMSTDGWAREQETASKMTAPQLTGSAATYAAKRALGNILAIDDSTADPDRTSGSELPQRSAAVPQREQQPSGDDWPQGIKCRSCGRTYVTCTSNEILQDWYSQGWHCACGNDDFQIVG